MMMSLFEDDDATMTRMLPRTGRTIIRPSALVGNKQAASPHPPGPLITSLPAPLWAL
mgnify:CR=1 FL=1